MEMETYKPSLVELMTVEWMQKHGAPKDVQFIVRRGVIVTNYSRNYMRFTLNGHSEDVDSIWTVCFPEVSMMDLEHAGLIAR